METIATNVLPALEVMLQASDVASSTLLLCV
jgi:hypothetical protein